MIYWINTWTCDLILTLEEPLIKEIIDQNTIIHKSWIMKMFPNQINTIFICSSWIMFHTL